MVSRRPPLISSFLFFALLAPVVALAQSSDPPKPVRTIHVAESQINLAGASAEQAGWLKSFQPTEKAFDAKLQEVYTDEAWQFQRVKYPSPIVTPWLENNVVPGELYLPTKITGKAPAAIVLDILDGSAIIPRGLARGLAEQGVIALYVPMACYGTRRPPGGAHFAYFADHPEKTADNLRQTVMDIRRAKALLAAMPEVDPDRISITGVSLGGIMTSLAAGVDGTFCRVVPILAGGDLATICFYSRETRRIREACEAKGIDRNQLAEMLKPVEPLSFASRIDPRRCLMINAARDEVIPAASTLALNKAIGTPTMLTVPVGHYGAMLFLPNIRQNAIRFIQGKTVERLDMEPIDASPKKAGAPVEPIPPTR